MPGRRHTGQLREWTLRIVFVNRYFAPDHSATSQILTDLATHLAAGGREVHVVCAAETYDGRGGLPEQQEIAGVNVHRVRSGGFGRAGLVRRGADSLVLYAAMYRGAARLLRPGDMLVAKTDPPLLSIPMARLAHTRKARFVNWLQDLYPEVAGALGVPLVDGPVGACLAGVRNWSLRKAELNVVIGELMREHLLAAGIEDRCIAVVPNWTDDETVRPVAAATNPLRAAWDLKARFVVGYSGNLGRAHEYETLLGAAARLRDRLDIVFLFVGGGHHVEMLRAEAERRGLSERFRFQPYQARDRLAVSLGVADVHWLSLRPELEGLIVPSKFYGIAAAGRPTLCVTDPRGEIARLVTRFDCGVVIAPGQDEALAAAIRNLADDPDASAAMGVRARHMLDAHFSKRRSLEQWGALVDGATRR